MCTSTSPCSDPTLSLSFAQCFSVAGCTSHVKISVNSGQTTFHRFPKRMRRPSQPFAEPPEDNDRTRGARAAELERRNLIIPTGCRKLDPSSPQQTGSTNVIKGHIAPASKPARTGSTNAIKNNAALASIPVVHGVDKSPALARFPAPFLKARFF